MKKKYVKNIKVMLLSILFISLVFVSVMLTILNIYVPVYKVTIANSEIGYFRNKQEFDELIYVLSKNLNEQDGAMATYLESEPVFEKIYVKYQNINTEENEKMLKAKLESEYEGYNVIVNAETKMTLNNYEEAEMHANLIKTEAKISNVKIEPIVLKDADEFSTSANANATTKALVSRHRAEELEKKREAERIAAEKAAAAKAAAAKAAAEAKRKQQLAQQASYVQGSSQTVSNNTVYTNSISGGTWPTTSRRISCVYGGYRGHTGLDIDGHTGDPNFAYKAGKVIFAGYSGPYGYLVKIDNGNGFQTYYAHNSKLLVRTGQEVSQGQTIALQGSTGNSSGDHLHFEMRINGIARNPQYYM